MIEEPSYLIANGGKIPIWCDLFVLNAIQEKYGQIREFEKKLLGITEKEVNGEIVKETAETDMQAVLWVLPLLIREGKKKEAADKGESLQAVNEYKIIAGLDMPISKIVEIIYEEYRRCFVTSKK